MSDTRTLRHKFAIGLGLVMLVALWYGLIAMEGEPIYKLEQAAGLVGGLIAFGGALAYARGRRADFPLGWAYLGTVVATAGLNALVLSILGGEPSANTVAASVGAGIGYGLPYLLVAYGWRGSSEPSDETSEPVAAASGSESPQVQDTE